MRHSVAIRFFRQLVVLQDDFYIKHLAEKNILGPVLDVLIRTLPRDNLLSSACLDLFGLINKENVKELIKHLVENHRDKVASLAHMENFREILAKYDQTQGYTATVDPYFLESEDELGRRPANAGARGMMEHLTVDPAQEDYWNTSDDEEENQARVISEQGSLTNGSTTRPLVEYNSDEEGDDNNGDTAMTSAVSPSSEEASKENKEPMPNTSPQTTVLPDRIPEKRRREDDEEDALDKLVSHKRRNSNASSASSVHSATAHRKKKGLGSRDVSPHGLGTRKISITISSSVGKSAVTAVKAAGGEIGEESK